ncbi:pantoate--beta-alanine ligase [Chlorobium phaeovibrioides]|uniref:pantoate--beta-alanine ligase n=1 Tax=Chlorobium phaeovibrioides TaxID=1094 RepID=UPI000F8290AD|nr:pantoate--beta-alanine ligase [Chlorobium phaeovibrioides]RTY35856.1 pantoate--beta-alanine ligase [Chlorobium phaeovibrioides]
MQTVTDPVEMQTISEKLRLGRQLIGVVMTMGALHEGHISLVKLAREQAGTVILTIFVNPTQFGPNEDFHRYPRPFEQDAALARSAGVDYLFAPEAGAIYPEGFSTAISCSGVSDLLEGEKRPGHFSGVATVVTKLLNITRPHLAVFGEKDAQQLAVIRRVVTDLNIPVKVVAAPTMRESNGLAVSSRNIYLTAGQRESAGAIWRSLQHALDRLAAGETGLKELAEATATMIASESGFRVDYVAFVDEETFMPAERALKGRSYRILAAVFADGIRLIDNACFASPTHIAGEEA